MEEVELSVSIDPEPKIQLEDNEGERFSTTKDKEPKIVKLEDNEGERFSTTFDKEPKFLKSGGGGGYSLQFSAWDLAATNGFISRTSHPFLLLVGKLGDGFRLLAETSVIRETLSPTWDPFIFFPEDLVEEQLRLEIRSFQVDLASPLLGYINITLSELLDSTGKEWPLTLPGQKVQGTLKLLKIDKVPPRDINITGYDITFQGEDLGYFFLTAEGYLKVFSHPLRKAASGALIKTEQLHIINGSSVVKEEGSLCTWSPLRLYLNDCDGLHSPLEIKVFSRSDFSSREDVYIGKVKTTLQNLLQPNFMKTIIHYGRAKDPVDKSYTPRSVLRVVNIQPIYEPQPDLNSFTFIAKAQDLDFKDFTLTSDPFFVVMAIPVPRMRYFYTNQSDLLQIKEFESTNAGMSSNPTVIYHSEIRKKTRQCQWEPFTLTDALCGGLHNPIHILVYDWNPNHNSDLIGEFTTSLNELTLPNAFFRLDNPSKKTLLHGSNTGIFEISDVQKGKARIPHPLSLPELHVKLRAIGMPKRSELRILAKPHAHTKIYSVYDHIINHEGEEFEIVFSPSRFGGMDAPIAVILSYNRKPKGKLITSMRIFSFGKKNPFIALPRAEPKKKNKSSQTQKPSKTSKKPVAPKTYYKGVLEIISCEEHKHVIGDMKNIV